MCTTFAMLGAARAGVADQAPLPQGVRSAIVLEEGVVVHREPDDRSGRRGTLRKGARVMPVRRVAGSGCGTGRFLEIRPRGFVCEHLLALSARPPEARSPTSSALPFEYLVVVHEGARAYLRPEDIAADEYDTALGKGFFVVARSRLSHDGIALVRTDRGHYMRASDLAPVSASRFEGVEVDSPDALSRLYWVIAERAAVRSVPDGAVQSMLARKTRLQAAGPPSDDGFVELVGGGFVASDALTSPRPSAVPEGVAQGERWIDVDLQRQVLVAYEGAQPRFATLISSGKPRRATRTPRGLFRIWVKLASSDMRDQAAEHELERSYAIEEVPWVQYFEGSYGLHAAFWHDRFGAPRSQGCVNLSPRDAQRLFQFTRPALPPGWLAILPDAIDRATPIRVR